MTMKVFEVFRRDTVTPLTVVAWDFEDAESIFGDWILTHTAEADPNPKRVVQRSDEWLADRPQLREAVDRGEAGVAYWLNHRDGWVVAPPMHPIAGAIAPYEPAVRYFRVEAEAEGDDAMVFARDADESVRLYIIYHQSAYGWLPEKFATTETSRWRLTGPLTTLREMMDGEMIGVAGWTLRDGWRIYPADHEAGD